MKVLLVTPYIASVYGGTSKVVIELSKSIGNYGLNVDIVTTNANAFCKLDVDLGNWINLENSRIQFFPCYHRNDFIISLSLLKWLFDHVNDYEIVHTNTVFSPLILLTHWICQFRQIRYLATPHGMLEPWALTYKAGKKRVYFSLFEKLALQKASAIHVLNTSEAGHLKFLGIEHSVVVPNGIQCQEFESLPIPEIFYQQFPNTRNKILILFLGRIDPKKGLDVLAKAFDKVHQIFPNTHLVVAGQDNIGFLPTAQSYFKEAGCSNAVTFTGMLTGDMKYSALKAANIYVAPSYSEGFSMSVLEGMASGLPCVITTGCNFPEAKGISEIVDIDAIQIANALIRLLQDPSRAKDMGDRARQFVLENYTWDKIASTMVATYKQILNKEL